MDDNNTLQQISGNSLTNKMFEILQNNILNGKYPQGEWLVESRLCEKFGVSRTPVREAIRQLEQEGLVKIIPNKGAVVSGVSAQDIKDIYTIRMLIEGLASRWAAEKITVSEIQELEEVIDLMRLYTEKNDVPRLLKADSRFHSIIYNASKSKPLIHTLGTFHHYVQKARSTSFQTPGRAQKALEEHMAIFQAIVEHNANESEKLTYQHVKKAGDNLLKQLEKGI
ncbi:transcriptional regulator [Desulfocucumis palustris]|uniref:Transcriptional regulator n=1 Tax=Desulfocucumis palustris TaxID=1898651 RepID=A0A2L2XCH7_9FIRM|nr:GntR family transcriptional regulator [Desulfocucumis palustris]GBF33403.1 transcriptional regulator [Desulfocucumis palustris]